MAAAWAAEVRAVRAWKKEYCGFCMECAHLAMCVWIATVGEYVLRARQRGDGMNVTRHGSGLGDHVLSLWCCLTLLLPQVYAGRLAFRVRPAHGHQLMCCVLMARVWCTCYEQCQ